MRNKFALVSFLLLSSFIIVTPQTSDPEFVEGRVILVPEGDEIHVRGSDGTVFTIRLHGLDAPERDQEYGAASRKELESRILDKEVKVLIHRKDSQGRYMGTVFREGQDIGVRLLEKGSAWHYKRVSGEQSSEARVRYAKAELKARESKAGLWAAAMPMPPWEFREEAEAGTEPGPVQPPTQLATTSAVKPDPRQTPATPSAPAEADKSGRTYHLGPRGGCYYLSSSGSKVYVKDKDLCSKP